ncbi:SGNH/GDSL hydrolase family protein [Ruegeria arenilitoris]|uniref:SGNH/GDSL hydrolase family protein n=1 Tax=Ruegeria arenilitoris TaxID=1173585 RepID=UPI003C7C4E82
MKQRIKVWTLLSLNFALIIVLALVFIREDYFVRVARKITGSPTPPQETIYYQTKVRLQERTLSQALETSQVQVAVTGDSIIEGWLTSAVLPKSINLGISRDDVPGLLSRTKPELVQHIPIWYLGIGVNDALTGAEITDIPAYIKQLSAVFAQADTLIWRAVLPVSGENWTDTQEKYLEAFNSAASLACRQMPNCTFLEPPAGYAENVSEWTSDGLHPNPEGYQRLTEQLCAIVPCFSDAPQ